MPMCKECKDVVSVFDIKDGLCANCQNGVKPTKKPIEEKSEKEKMEETSNFFANVFGWVVALVVLFFFVRCGGDEEPTLRESIVYGEPTQISITSIGCEDKALLSDATGAYLKGGLSALSHYRGCIMVLKGQPIERLKLSGFKAQVLYHFYESERLLWVGADVIE